MLLLCVAGWDTVAQRHVFCERLKHYPGKVVECHWTILVGNKCFGLVQVQQARDACGDIELIHEGFPNSGWHRVTTVHLGFTRFTTRTPAWLVATLVTVAFGLVLAFFGWQWRRKM
jgi:hypothetical protein